MRTFHLLLAAVAAGSSVSALRVHRNALRSSLHQRWQPRFRRVVTIVRAEEDGEAAPTATTEEVDDATPLSSLEAKMQSWEATDEDRKAATLGGLTPGSMDGFDIGLAIAFPFIVGTCLLFLLFPFIGENLAAGSRDTPAYIPDAPPARVIEAAPAAVAEPAVSAPVEAAAPVMEAASAAASSVVAAAADAVSAPVEAAAEVATKAAADLRDAALPDFSAL